LSITDVAIRFNIFAYGCQHPVLIFLNLFCITNVDIEFKNLAYGCRHPV